MNLKITNEAVRKLNTVKPIEFFKPVKGEDGKESEKYYITDQCNVYRKKDVDNYNCLRECKKLNMSHTEDNRLRGSVDYKNGRNKAQVMPRVLLRSFDESTEFTPEFFKTHEANHINPEKPLDNSIYNLEWVTHKENMRKAIQTGAMGKKCNLYSDDTIHKICQMTSEGKSRMEIRQELNVKGQFIDDIRAGRSHKDISSQYLDKGFKYKVNDRAEKRERAEEICKLLVEGYSTTEIMKMMDLPNLCVVNDIKHKRAYKYISDNYF